MFGPFLPGGVIVDRFDERVGKGIDVVRLDEPAVRLPGDGVDEGDGSTGAGRDHWQTARHRLEEHLPERLVDRRADEDVGTRQPQRELVVPAPTALKKTPSTTRSRATVCRCSPSHSPGDPPQIKSGTGVSNVAAPERRLARGAGRA